MLKIVGKLFNYYTLVYKDETLVMFKGNDILDSKNRIAEFPDFKIYSQHGDIEELNIVYNTIDDAIMQMNTEDVRLLYVHATSAGFEQFKDNLFNAIEVFLYHQIANVVFNYYNSEITNDGAHNCGKNCGCCKAS